MHWRATRLHTPEWHRGFVAACLLFVAVDVLVNQCNVAFLVGFVIPRTVRAQIYGAREEAIKAAKKFWQEYRLQKFVSPQDMNLSVLAPDMDLYQQAEEEGKTELEVHRERGR